MPFLGSRHFGIHSEILHVVKCFLLTWRLPPNMKDLFASLVSATTIVISNILWNLFCGSEFFRQLPVCHGWDSRIASGLEIKSPESELPLTQYCAHLWQRTAWRKTSSFSIVVGIWVSIKWHLLQTERSLKESRFYWRCRWSWCTQSPFVICMSWRAQFGRKTSFGMRVGFIGSTHNLHYVYVFSCIWDATSEFVQLFK